MAAHDGGSPNAGTTVYPRFQHGGSHASDIAMSMGVSRHVSFYYLFFNNSLLYCTIHCQINISESSKMLSDS